MLHTEHAISRALILVFVFAGIATYSSSAYAYIGPGLGAGTIAAVLGLIGAFFVGIFAIVYYPIKRTIREQKRRRHAKLQP